jgi:thiol-disulfide isomerase/thioredoxin
LNKENVVKENTKKEKSFTKKNVQCLMIEIDNKRLFTQKKSAPLLVELAKKFNAVLSIVKVKTANVFSIQVLTKKLEEDYTENDVSFQVLQKFEFGSPDQTIIKEILKPKTEKEIIQEVIESLFIQRKPVLITKLIESFPHVKQSSLRYYVKKTKEELEKEGYHIIKFTKGGYIVTAYLPALEKL